MISLERGDIVHSFSEIDAIGAIFFQRIICMLASSQVLNTFSSHGKVSLRGVALFKVLHSAG